MCVKHLVWEILIVPLSKTKAVHSDAPKLQPKNKGLVLYGFLFRVINYMEE